MKRFILIAATTLSLSVFALPISKCQLEHFKNHRSYTTIRIDAAKTTGPSAQQAYFRLKNLYPLNLMHNPIGEEAFYWLKERVTTQEGTGKDKCGNEYTKTTYLDQICIYDVGSKKYSCDKFCFYISTEDPDCEY